MPPMLPRTLPSSARSVVPDSPGTMSTGTTPTGAAGAGRLGRRTQRATRVLTGTVAFGSVVAALGLPTSAHAAPVTDAPAATSAATSPTRSTLTHRSFGYGSMGWRSEEHERATTGTARALADHALPVAARSMAGSTVGPAARAAVASNSVRGIDVSSWQGNVSWSAYRSAGKQFAYVKATEGASYHNPYFNQQYNGSASAGMYRGAYHFATPNRTKGKTQADYFIAHGGGWHRDGRTLPGVLDIEYNPYGSTCYGLSAQSMVVWINDFVVEYKRRTGRDAVIYTNADWWSRCTGNTTRFNKTNPLWVARYGTSSPGTLPGHWPFYTFWQYSPSPIDQDVFSASLSRLGVLARG